MERNTDLGARLSALRKQRNISQHEVARIISRSGSEITNRAVSKWETGDSLPNAEQFIALCRIYDVRDVLSTFLGISAPDVMGESGFSSLNQLGRERAIEYISMLAERPEFSHRNKIVHIKRQLPLYDLPASAGPGVFLDSDSYTLIDADENVPDSANIAVRISGDSMLPLFCNGQTVYVQQQLELKSGEIGIFVLNGEAYCKKLETTGGIQLISLNPAYKPIKLENGDEFRVVGKVIN